MSNKKEKVIKNKRTEYCVVCWDYITDYDNGCYKWQQYRSKTYKTKFGAENCLKDVLYKRRSEAINSMCDAWILGLEMQYQNNPTQECYSVIGVINGSLQEVIDGVHKLRDEIHYYTALAHIEERGVVETITPWKVTIQEETK